jgi:hypothetical protein
MAEVEDIRRTAIRSLERLTHAAHAFDSPTHLEAVVVAAQLMQMAVAMPLASLGTCGQDGTDLHYTSDDNDLLVCCDGDPRHCWRVGTAR